MSVLVVTPPPPLVTLQDAKEHVKATTHDEDALVELYLRAASAHIDGPFGILGRAVGRQTLEYRSHCFTAIDRLPSGPVSEISSVNYISALGVEETLDPLGYGLHEDRFQLSAGYRWPTIRGDAGGVRVRYIAGFPTVPLPIQHATLLLVGQWYRNRMAVNVGNIVNELPNGVRALLAPYKVWRV